jgi:hypothetical protein
MAIEQKVNILVGNDTVHIDFVEDRQFFIFQGTLCLKLRIKFEDHIYCFKTQYIMNINDFKNDIMLNSTFQVQIPETVNINCAGVK